MTQNGGTCVKAELFSDQLNKHKHAQRISHDKKITLIIFYVTVWAYVLDKVTGDGFAVAIQSTFCHNDDIQTMANASLLHN